jgi:hypothetical protein
MKNFGIVDNKYVWKWLVKLSLNLFFHRSLCILLSYLNVENLQVHFRATSCWKWIIFSNSSIFTHLYKFGQPKKVEKNMVSF